MARTNVSQNVVRHQVLTTLTAGYTDKAVVVARFGTPLTTIHTLKVDKLLLGVDHFVLGDARQY